MIDEKHVSNIGSNSKIGTAAEFFVVAELLFRGFNATRLPFDTGLDVFAIKDKEVFFIQVKHLSLNSDSRIKISANSFFKNGNYNVFYIIVIAQEKERSVLILPKFKIQEVLGWENANKVEEGKIINLKIKQADGKFYLSGIKEIEVNDYINNWEVIG